MNNNETKDLEKQEQVELGNLNNLTQNEVLDTNKKGKSKNPNILGAIIIVILVLAIIGILLYVAKDNGYLDKYFKKQPEVTETKEEIPESEKMDYMGEKEKIITDESIISKIQSKDEKINYDVMIIQTEKEEFTDSDRVETIVSYMFEQDIAKDFPVQDITKLRKEMDIENNEEDCNNHISLYSMCLSKVEGTPKIISFEDAAAFVKEFYNHDIEKIGIVTVENGMTYLDENIYMGEKASKDPYILQFKYLIDGSNYTSNKATRENKIYTEDDDNYYVYFYYSITDHDGYTYYSLKEWYNLNAEVPKDRKELKLTKDNYEDFSLVKVTYKKDGNNFYYDKIETIKEVK